ncbi:MAG: recombinase [Flavobacterium sp.]|nr:recombinase [Flavobacterium sp.]
MFKKKVKKKPNAIDYILSCCNENAFRQTDDDDLEILVDIIRLIRPSNPNAVDVNLTDLIRFLQSNRDCTAQLAEYIKRVLHRMKFNKFLSDAAILQDVDFFFEIRKRLIAKMLPNQPQKDRLEYVLNQVFYKASDTVWINRIPVMQLEALYDVLQFDSIYSTVEKDSPLSELLIAMHLLTQRMSGRAMETDVVKMVPEFDDLESPFAAFEKELLLVEERIRNSGQHYIESDDLSYRHMQVLHKQCELFVAKAFSNSAKYGISLRVNQNLLKIRQQLERLRVLVPLLVAESPAARKRNSIDLALQLIKYNCYKNNVRKFISESTQLISYEVTQHTAKTGETYITEGRTEYWKMFKAALGGGFIVGLLCIIKVLLGKIDTSPFAHAILYSLNYAVGFILIYLLGFTLATKQPAMTASTLAKSIDEDIRKKHQKTGKYSEFAILFARVFRSQFIAFVGNVIMAFPVALIGVYLINLAFDYNIAAAKSYTLLTDISPVHSHAIFHAAIAGVFLFLSGIISGSIANRDRHGQIYYRIEEHPVLKKSFGKARTKKFAKLYEKKWAGIVSNFWFGVFMGTTGSIGFFLGLDLDVRHITFVSGNLALGLFGADWQITFWLLFWCLLGIGVVGLVNFVVSFSLSLGLAFRSRNISWLESRFVIASIWKHFKQKPLSFFFPTKKKEASVVASEYLKSH